ncbi:hypothetical protein Tco_1574800, partial [Tanacetum coccineum]
MMISTSVFVDLEISNQADGAQSSRVPVLLPKDPYEASRQAYLVGMDTESETFEDLETETHESPHTVASPTPLPNSTPPTCHVEELEGSDMSGARSTSSDSTAPLSPDHPLTHTTPALVPSLCRTTRMAVRVPPAMSPSLSASIAEVATMSDLAFRKRVEDEEEEEDEEIEESSDSDSGDAVVPEGQQQAALVVETAMGKPLGLGYRALRRQEIALGEGRMPSVFEVGQSFGSVPESETAIDVPAYPPPAPPVQTPTSPEWSSGLLPVSQAPFIVPSPISSPMISLTVPSLLALPAKVEAEGFLTDLGAQVEMQGGLIRDHTERLEE